MAYSCNLILSCLFNLIGIILSLIAIISISWSTIQMHGSGSSKVSSYTSDYGFGIWKMKGNIQYTNISSGYIYEYILSSPYYWEGTIEITKKMVNANTTKNTYNLRSTCPSSSYLENITSIESIETDISQVNALLPTLFREYYKISCKVTGKATVVLALLGLGFGFILFVLLMLGICFGTFFNKITRLFICCGNISFGASFLSFVCTLFSIVAWTVQVGYVSNAIKQANDKVIALSIVNYGVSFYAQFASVGCNLITLLLLYLFTCRKQRQLKHEQKDKDKNDKKEESSSTIKKKSESRKNTSNNHDHTGYVLHVD